MSAKFDIIFEMLYYIILLNMLKTGGIMKKTVKLISLLLFTAIITSLFVSCAADELTLLNALYKSSDITSMESKTELSLRLEASGFSEQDQQTIQQVTSMLNESKITINQKMKSNADKTSTKAKVDVSVDMGGMALSTSMWLDSDFSGAKPKMKEIIKVPTILDSFMPTEYQGKPYLVLDMNQLMSTSPDMGFDYKKLSEFSKNITPKIVEFMKEYFTQFDPGFTAITRKADKTVNGQTLAVYKLKLDDAAFKSLIDYGVTNFIQNEKALTFTKDFLISVIDITSITTKEKAKGLQEINKTFDEFKAGIPAFKDQWVKVMNVLKDVKILGEKGIDIEFGINSEGYIVSEDGTVDLLIDMKALADAGENLSLLQNSKYKKQISTQTGILKIGFDFHNVTSNINKDVSIIFPTLNSKNSFSFMDIMDSMMIPEPPKDITPPKAPVVNKVLRTAKTLTGKAEIGSTIIVKNGKTIIGTGVVNSKGIYSIKIKPQKIKSKLLVTAIDFDGNISKATTVIVK
jgi:hypothetical protein